LLKKFTVNNSVFARVICVAIIVISVCCIGYMVGKFTWYLSN
jgi:hypothetical protein